jgi:hypothetical protein
MCIEFNGIQHYKSFKYLGGLKELKEIQKRDLIKKNFAIENNIRLLIIPYTEFNNIELILTKELYAQ